MKQKNKLALLFTFRPPLQPAAGRILKLVTMYFESTLQRRKPISFPRRGCMVNWKEKGIFFEGSGLSTKRGHPILNIHGSSRNFSNGTTLRKKPALQDLNGVGTAERVNCCLLKRFLLKFSVCGSPALRGVPATALRLILRVWSDRNHCTHPQTLVPGLKVWQQALVAVFAHFRIYGDLRTKKTFQALKRCFRPSTT